MLTSDFFNKPTTEEKTRLDPKCWTGKKIGDPKTKMKGGVRVNNCVPVEEETENNPIDTVKMDVPLLIRALEYAREDVKNDVELHKVVERMIAAAQAGEALNMDDYNMIFGDSESEHEQDMAEELAYEPDEKGLQHSRLTMPQNTLVIDTPGDLDWYKLGHDIANLNQADPHEYGQSDSDVVITTASPEEMQKLMKQLDRLGLRYKLIGGTDDQPEIHDEKFESVAEATGDKPFDSMMKNISTGTAKQKTADRKEQRKQTQQQARDAFGNMFGGGNPADKLKIKEQGVAEAQLDELTGMNQGPVKRDVPQRKKPTFAELAKQSTDKRSALQRQKDGGKKNWFAEDGVAEGQFDPINDDDFYEYNVNTNKIVKRISGKHPIARQFSPMQKEWAGRDADHKIVKGMYAKYLKPKGQDVVDEAKKKKKKKSSLMSKPTKRTYGGYFYPGYGYGDSGDSGGGDGGGGESRVNEKTEKTKLNTLDIRSELDSHAITLLNIARRKYPMAKSDLAALIKLVDRVQMHSKEKDTTHDKDIKAIRRDVAALEKRVTELYKKQKVKESRSYYTISGTLAESLRKDFKMRKDRKGWFLPESADSKARLDAERAFGQPINEADLLRPIKMNATKDPVARSKNASKFKNPAKLIQFKR